MALTDFSIDAQPGETTITVDGEPVVGAVAFSLEQLDRNTPPLLTLYAAAGGRVEGRGVVQATAGAQSVADFLTGIDPGTLDELVMAEMQGMRGTFSEVALVVLCRMAGVE